MLSSSPRIAPARSGSERLHAQASAARQRDRPFARRQRIVQISEQADVASPQCGIAPRDASAAAAWTAAATPNGPSSVEAR